MKKFVPLLLAAALVSAVFCAAFVAPLTASAAGTNLAQGKRITGADPTNGNQYTDKYNASLLDGLASDEFDPNGAPDDWFAYYYNAEPIYPSNAVAAEGGAVGEFTIDLNAPASVESVRIHMFANDSHTSQGIKAPARIVVETSADNASWKTFGEETDFSGYRDIDWVEIKGSAAGAQYVKVSIYYPGYTLLLNEVQVIGEPSESKTVPSDARFEVFDLTPVDADVDWYQDGIVVAIPNDSSETLTIASGDYQLRYVFILIFDETGVCTQVGNNLLSADDERASEFPQHDIQIPAGGFAVLFYYNANEGPSNIALYEYYEELGGTAYSNETGRAASGKNYVAELENNTVTIYFAAAEAPAEPSDEPSDEPSEETSEEPSAEPSDEPSEEPSEETPDASSEEPDDSDSKSSDPSSTAPTTDGGSDTDVSGEEDGGSNLVLIIGIVAAVVVAAGVVVAVVIVKKKKG